MFNWIVRRQSVFAQLVAGALIVLVGIAGLWLGSSSYFLRVMDRAIAQRWMAVSITNQLLQARVQEKEFLLHEAKDSSFLKTGDAPTLQDHDAELSLTRQWIDSLANISTGQQKTDAQQLKTQLGIYDTSFHNLVDAIRKHGDALDDKPGRWTDEQNALQAKMYDAADAISPTIARTIVASVQATAAARRQLVVASQLISLVGIIIAVIFFYVFARGVSRMTMSLERAANDVGEGRFTSRVKFRTTNELGRLGKAFNTMADNLAALVGAVHQSSIQMNTSTMEIASTAREQQATASAIAATTRQVGVTAKEISATSLTLAETVKAVSSVAEETATLAGTGQVGLTKLDDTMQQLSQASGAVNARLTALSEKAENITSVVTTIVKVADQTNLLSLNAEIEAEKAGEYGRGFAVVAGEIRRLADQTALATSGIEQIIKEMQSAVTAGVMGMDKFSDEVRRGVDVSNQVSGQLSEIIRKVQTLAPHLETVNEGMQSQADSAHQISDALAQLTASVQQTAESLAQSNRAIEQLNDAAQNLQTGVSRFSMSA